MSTNYKKTLNLPKTDFPMRAKLKQLEPQILNMWQEKDIYQQALDAASKSEKFVVHDGPPYANGHIHIGHALNKILKDIVVKYKIMQNMHAPFIPGWDCHGLPVEHQLFKKMKTDKNKVDIVEFREKARDFALNFVNLQKKDFQRIAIFAKWQNPYLTLGGDYEYWVLKLLQDLNSKGYVYRGRKPVNWCPQCETALAEAEVEYAQKKSPSIYFLFPVVDSDLINQESVYFLVWTTTPWTLISNVAVALHPELEYGLYKMGDKKILLARDLKAVVEGKTGVALDETKTFHGRDLTSTTLKHPFLKRNSQVVNADFVSKQEGSGCVHIAPGHGQDDFSLVKKYDLPIIMPLDKKGVFGEGAGEYQNKTIDEANKEIIQQLEGKGLLLSSEEIDHSYPHCWRCKNPVIFRATYQWFLNIDHNQLRQRLLEQTEDVTWIPRKGQERIKAMLSERPDWCLSRQRLWGIPIPALRCQDCQQIILDSAVISRVAEIFKSETSNSWFKNPASYFIPEGFNCPHCHDDNFAKEHDILDVWFESGASFLAVVDNNQDLRFPADLYLEGGDQHRGWFQASLIPSVAHKSQPPFKSVLTHGFVVDGEGKKMSKSLGNVISPQKIINDYGAEILRLWVSASNYCEDVKISPAIIKQLVDIYRKIRNTLRFILGNISDFNPQEKIDNPDDLFEIDKFMLAKLAKLRNQVIDEYDDFSFYHVCRKIFDFSNLDLSSFYLDALKDRLYTYGADSQGRRSAQTVLYWTLKVLIKLIAPVFPFTAEQAFSHFHNWAGKKDSVFLHKMSEDQQLDKFIDKEALKNGERMLGMRTQVLREIERKREKGIIGTSLEAHISLSLDKEYDFFKSRQEQLKEVFVVSGVDVSQGEFNIKVDKSRGEKCPRCWNYREDIGEDGEYPDVCLRCAEALKGGKNG